MSRAVNILFLCVANSARSQLAEGLAKKIFAEAAQIASAGSRPSGHVQPWAVEVLREQGIDISKNFSKSIDDLSPDFLQNLDYVITLCAEEECPVLPLKAKRIHWPIPDPAMASETDKPRAFAEASREIRKRIEDFKSILRI